MLRHFQRFVSKRRQPLAQETLSSWLKAGAAQASLTFVIDRAVFVKKFLDWRVERAIVPENPFSQLRVSYDCPSTAAIARALLDPQPAKALEALRPPPRYASHWGPLIREHVERMRTLGFRYRNENWFLRFDRYVQRQPDAENAPFAKLARDYVAAASSAAEKLNRLRLARVVAGALQPAGVAVTKPTADRLLLQEVARKRPRPYIHSIAEIEKLLDTARHYTASKLPLRAAVLHCMIALPSSLGRIA
jgi:integrase